MIFILNTSEQITGTLSRFGASNKVTPYFDDKHVIDLSTGAETFTFSTFANTKESTNIVGGNFVAFQVENGFKLFQISEVTEEHNEEHIKTAYCEMAGIELINEIIRATNIPSASLKQALTLALQDTEYKVGTIDSSLVNVHSIELKDPIKVYDFLQKYIIGTYGAEISFRVEIKGGRIVGKYIDCYAERGDFSGVRFEYGKNISKVKKVADFTELATALVCQGKNGTTISSVEADDKPVGQDWIGNEEAYQQYSRNGSHIFDIFKYDTESPAELLLEARKELAERCKPKLKYEVDVEILGTELNIGDTVYIVDNEFNPPLHLSARVSQIQKHRTDWRKDKVILSNYKEVVSRITEEDRDIASLLDQRFPIGTSDIKDGAVTSNKIPTGQIQSTHIKEDTITTDHLKAKVITSDKIDAGQIHAEHINAEAIRTEHLKAELITSEHISAGTIESEHIKADAIESDHIKANQINTNHLQANTITTDHIQAGQVVGSHILGDQIDANHIKANAITTEKIEANAITSDKIEANAITSDKILAGEVEADHLSTNSVTADKIQAGAITTDKIQANSITGDKVQANAILSTHVKANQIEANHLKANSITTDKVVAGAITSDKIGANQIQAEHIKAGSIDASKLSAGEIISDKAQIGTGVITSAHIGSGQITNAHIGKGAIGEANILDGVITSAKITNGSITNAKIEDATIESAKIKSINAGKINAGTLNTGLINIEGTNGKLRVRDNRLQVFDQSSTPVERVSLGDVDGDGTRYGLRVRGTDGTTILYDENGVYSEGITDGAITNPKIEENAVDSRTLNLRELFVEDSAFINELQATKIKASQLQVDEIRNDLINLSGLISFDSLNPELNDLLFIKDSDKTYINGNTILTNTIKASQIDLYNGLNVKKDGLDTFAVATDGSVKVSGTIESFGFSNEAGQERGYRLTPEGDAYLNDAVVRGSVILPKAGITNFGEVEEVDPVRFWAGASYEDRETAPFRVYESGKIKATEGEFGGTFTGELSIGNILIKDTNSTSAELSIKTNNNANEVIKLTDNSARFDVDFSIGNILRASVQTNELDFGEGIALELGKGGYKATYGKNTSTSYDVYNISNSSGGVHTLTSNNGYGGLSFLASGTRETAGSETPYDYKFARASSNEAVSVVVKGNLVVDNKITMADNNKIELVSISGDNSGIDFMIR